MKKEFDFIRCGLLGLIAADALGVPAEFRSRDELFDEPIEDMTGFGTHNQPAGSWSDDSSMTLCTMDSLCRGYDLQDMMQRFCAWMYEDAYTPHGKTFDFGGITRRALNRFRCGYDPLECGEEDERSNGNGSLMRILPVVFRQYLLSDGFEDENCAELLHPVWQVSALTHAHPVSTVGCCIYARLIAAVIRAAREKMDKAGLMNALQDAVYLAWNDQADEDAALLSYRRLMDMQAFGALPGHQIKSSGYIVHTLEAALWCFLNTDSYRECVLEAVNLGDDTDTVAAVAGSFAGIYYGAEAIPEKWLSCLARLDWLEERIGRFTRCMEQLKGAKADV